MVSGTDSAVLIYGETRRVGKELVAQSVHGLSRRIEIIGLYLKIVQPYQKILLESVDFWND